MKVFLFTISILCFSFELKGQGLNDRFALKYNGFDLQELKPEWPSYNSIYMDSIELPRKGIGAELKGMYISGGTAFGLGLLYGTLLHLSTTDDDFFGPHHIPTGGTWAGIPMSLVGLGAGSLIGRNHSDFNGAFMIGSGLVLAPKFRYKAKDPKRVGVHFRVLSPEIGKWRYNFSFRHYFTLHYIAYERAASNTWWDFSLDIHYLIKPVNRLTVYPFMGANLFYFNEKGFYPGDVYPYDNTYHYQGANLGLGLSYQFFDKWQFYTEVRFMTNRLEDEFFYGSGLLFALY